MRNACLDAHPSSIVRVPLFRLALVLHSRAENGASSDDAVGLVPLGSRDSEWEVFPIIRMP
jgi:hypothetical protein